MLKLFHHKFQKNVVEIYAGDYYATNQRDVFISTVLGSCIAVCLVDKVTGIMGMNHFMLPGRRENDSRYGINAMELLIQCMVDLGASRERLTAKVFGGASYFDNRMINVAQKNISFIMQHLAGLNIPVEASDTGKGYGRKVFFCANTYNVYLQKIDGNCDSNKEPEGLFA